ncbi:MAG: NAD-dependent protein deacylase [Candidatus Anammoximicrobium sp.]|nr:NAD-dependent protein deacylase [Candidatus Anammoximicrobium sp.]
MSLTDEESRKIDRVVDLLDDCRSLLFVTGAGISADSGLPTYRGIGGLYDADRTEEGFAIEEVLSGPMIRRAPELTWKYLIQIARAARGARHNRGHEVIAQLERHFERVWTLTQNVDGYHRAAGSQRLIEIHGDLHDVYCVNCSWRQHVTDYDAIEFPPRCPQCGSIVRPDVVLFGEYLPPDKVQQLRAECRRGFDAVFSVGTTSVFPYIVEPVWQAHQQGRPTIEINPGETAISDWVDVKLAMRAAPALDAIWTRYRQRQGAGGTG